MSVFRISSTPIGKCAVLLILLNSFSLESFAADSSSTTETISDVLQFGLPALAYTATFVQDDEAGRNEFYTSFLTNVAATQVLKHSIHKQRPNKEDNDAFPSGHTSMAFQAASFIQFRYGWEYSIPFYVAASYVGWAREKINEHDTSDVLAGAAIGFASSYFLTTPFKNLKLSAYHSESSDIAIALNYRW